MSKRKPGEVVQVYATMINTDGNEGRGQDIPIAYFWNESDARKYGKGKDVMGTDGKVKPCWAVVDEGGATWIGVCEEILDGIQDAERAAALAKLKDAGLTPREKRLLGIEE